MDEEFDKAAKVVTAYNHMNFVFSIVSNILVAVLVHFCLLHWIFIKIHFILLIFILGDIFTYLFSIIRDRLNKSHEEEYLKSKEIVENYIDNLIDKDKK